MIDYSDVLSLQYLTGQVFTGSCSGMRYRIWSEADQEDVKEKTAENAHLEAAVWPEPLAYSVYGPENTERRSFEFSEDGRRAAIDWLNEMHSKF